MKGDQFIQRPLPNVFVILFDWPKINILENYSNYHPKWMNHALSDIQFYCNDFSHNEGFRSTRNQIFFNILVSTYSVIHKMIVVLSKLLTLSTTSMASTSAKTQIFQTMIHFWFLGVMKILDQLWKLWRFLDPFLGSWNFLRPD